METAMIRRLTLAAVLSLAAAPVFAAMPFDLPRLDYPTNPTNPPVVSSANGK
jgi:hypothetical protein